MLYSVSGQDTPNKHQQSQFKQPLNPSNQFTCTLTNNNPFSLCSLSGTTGSNSSILNKHINNSNINESDPDVLSHLIHTSVSDEGLLISKASCVSDTSTESSTGHRPVNESVHSLSKEKSDGGMTEGWKDDVKRGKNNIDEQEKNEKQQWNRDEIQGEDVKEGGSAGETRGTLVAQTTDRADRREDSQRSTEDVEDTKQPETETKDTADGAEERGKTGPHMPETQILVQTTTDTTAEKSDTQQVVDFMDTEPPLAACAPSDCSQSLSQKVSEKVEDSSHVNKGFETRREVHTFCSDEHQSVRHGPNSGIQEVQRLGHDEANTFAQDQVFEKTTEEMPSDKSAANIPTELCEPQNQSSICSSQINTAALPAQSDNINNLETKQTQRTNPSDITSNMKQTYEMCDTHVRKDGVLLEIMVEPQALPQISQQEVGQPKSLVTDDDDDDDCRAFKKREGQSNVDTPENNACEPVQRPVGKSNLEDPCVDITIDTADLESEVETGRCQEHMKNNKAEDADDAKTTKGGADLKLSASSSHENDASPQTFSKKCYEQSPAKEMLLDDTNESFLPSNMTYRSAFDWASAQRKAVSSRTKSDVSVLHQFVQVSQLKNVSITI